MVWQCHSPASSSEYILDRTAVLTISALASSNGQSLISSGRGLHFAASRWNLAPGNHAGMYFTNRAFVSMQVIKIQVIETHSNEKCSRGNWEDLRQKESFEGD
jgi:hypothetical protein